MKFGINKIVSIIVQNDIIWKILNASVIRAARGLEWRRAIPFEAERDRKTLELLNETIASISPNLKVKNGPFKDMQYLDKMAIGSTLLPKLLGSYERELQPLIEQMCLQPYSEIVDIGCAEGYYAVGLAMRIASAKVYAFDTNPEALRLCRRMAQANNVSDRVITGGFCDPAMLRALPFRGKSLIVSDCEGYEKILFTEEIVPCLAKHDLLVEIHDCNDIEISRLIRDRFSQTHMIQRINSIDDIAKAHTYNYDELHGFNLATRKWILAERRPVIMEWFFMTPRVSHTSAITHGGEGGIPQSIRLKYNILA